MTEDAAHWHRANDIARAALAGTLYDNSKNPNPDHYHNVDEKPVGGLLLRWAEDGIKNHEVTVTIGHHMLLKLQG